jgi:hypothetical protein
VEAVGDALRRRARWSRRYVPYLEQRVALPVGEDGDALTLGGLQHRLPDCRFVVVPRLDRVFSQRQHDEACLLITVGEERAPRRHKVGRKAGIVGVAKQWEAVDRPHDAIGEKLVRPHGVEGHDDRLMGAMGGQPRGRCALGTQVEHRVARVPEVLV